MAANSLTYQFKMANMAIKIIVLNVLVFVLLTLLPRLGGPGVPALDAWLVLPDTLGRFMSKPWSLFTYAFVHMDIWHILWNMYFLYLFSRFVLNLFSAKRFLTIYFLGGILGGIAYLLAYAVFPGLALETGGNVRGASAAVVAIIVFIATYSPNNEIRVFKWSIKLWHIAAFFFLRDLLTLGTSPNAGGLITHIAGAAFGYVYARQLVKGNDIGAWFEAIMDTIASWFSSKPRVKKAKMKTVHRNAKKKTKDGVSRAAKADRNDQQKKIDAILDKISKSGYDSLSQAEKDFLFKVGK